MPHPTQCGCCGDPILTDDYVYNDVTGNRVHGHCDDLIESMSVAPVQGICECGNEKDVDEAYCEECYEIDAQVLDELQFNYERSVMI